MIPEHVSEFIKIANKAGLPIDVIESILKNCANISFRENLDAGWKFGLVHCKYISPAREIQIAKLRMPDVLVKRAKLGFYPRPDIVEELYYDIPTLEFFYSETFPSVEVFQRVVLRASKAGMLDVIMWHEKFINLAPLFDVIIKDAFINESLDILEYIYSKGPADFKSGIYDATCSGGIKLPVVNWYLDKFADPGTIQICINTMRESCPIEIIQAGFLSNYLPEIYIKNDMLDLFKSLGPRENINHLRLYAVLMGRLNFVKFFCESAGPSNIPDSNFLSMIKFSCMKNQNQEILEYLLSLDEYSGLVRDKIFLIYNIACTYKLLPACQMIFEKHPDVFARGANQLLLSEIVEVDHLELLQTLGIYKKYLGLIAKIAIKNNCVRILGWLKENFYLARILKNYEFHVILDVAKFGNYSQFCWIIENVFVEFPTNIDPKNSRILNQAINEAAVSENFDMVKWFFANYSGSIKIYKKTILQCINYHEYDDIVEFLLKKFPENATSEVRFLALQSDKLELAEFIGSLKTPML